MKRYRFLLPAMLIAMLLLLVGCSQPAETTEKTEEPAAPVEQATLVGTQWMCSEFGTGTAPTKAIESAPISAQFGTDGRLNGIAGINSYSTGYGVNGAKMSVNEEIVTTQMAGDEAAMKQEAAYLAVLPLTATFEIKGDTLTLFDKTKKAIAVYKNER